MCPASCTRKCLVRQLALFLNSSVTEEVFSEFITGLSFECASVFNLLVYCNHS